VQGFVYDLRTAILPFMFIFNTDLLLWGVTAWWQIGLIFVSAMVAMLAFASLTQNYMLTRNRLYESAILLLSTGMILRPRLVGELLVRFGLSASIGSGPRRLLSATTTWYLVGPMLFVAVWLLQRRRLRRG
jgi:TRAP-type uncharacterized transport system fused permease subunit